MLLKIKFTFLILFVSLLGGCKSQADYPSDNKTDSRKITRSKQSTPMNPAGKMHLPIGIPNTVDTLKTFVEPEGCFSPGVGSFGVYYWVYDKNMGRLISPTDKGVECEYGLADGGLLIPWTEYTVDEVTVRTELCQVKRSISEGEVHIVAGRAELTNSGSKTRDLRLYIALRPVGPAGFDVQRLDVGDDGNALLVDGHTAIASQAEVAHAGVVSTDTIWEYAIRGMMPDLQVATSDKGDCSGALCFDIKLKPGKSRAIGLICPVLAGRRAVGHKWDGVSEWAQFDLAQLNPSEGGLPQPDPGVEYCQSLDVDELFDEATDYWRQMTGRVKLNLPDKRWAEAYAAIVGHVAMAMNEGAPDVAVMNYNVFNRDGVYVVNILQQAGRADLAREGIDYFLAHPFNGRSYPEADNPGQILWVIGEHWLYTRDKDWLKGIYPSVVKLAEMIRYYRTAPEPHWVQVDGLVFGEDVPEDKRHKLEPGRCDGKHPEYTEAFDIAGMRAAAVLASVMDDREQSQEYMKLARKLFGMYDKQFGEKLGDKYGKYSVLWPCRLYKYDSGKAFEQFRDTGVQEPSGWRYFPLATAHQGLLAGNRNAGFKTIDKHLAHEQMRRWYVFDEGGKSGSGGWGHVRSTWDGSVAMPHGWAVAELFLLMRDSLVYENEGKLVLFSGVDTKWHSDPAGIEIRNMPTHYGLFDIRYEPQNNGATVSFSGRAKPPNGLVLCLPDGVSAEARIGDEVIATSRENRLQLPMIAGQVDLIFK